MGFVWEKGPRCLSRLAYLVLFVRDGHFVKVSRFRLHKDEEEILLPMHGRCDDEKAMLGGQVAASWERAPADGAAGPEGRYGCRHCRTTCSLGHNATEAVGCSSGHSICGDKGSGEAAIEMCWRTAYLDALDSCKPESSRRRREHRLVHPLLPAPR
eukprot:scaffold214409_cov33-Tisochrysis_lutea.AAC.4